MNKVPIIGRKRKLQIIDRFIDVMLTRESFLLAGHRNPDEDCVASLVAFSLLLGKFNKQNAVVLNRDNWAKYPYLLNICKYNSIRVIGSADEIGSGYDTLIAFDTPKPEMLDFKKTLDVLMEKDDVLVLEIDHHLEADGTYIGDEGYRLVDRTKLRLKMSLLPSVRIRFFFFSIFTARYPMSSQVEEASSTNR